MGDISRQIALEGVKAIPALPPEELVLHMAKCLLCCRIVQTVTPARHASRDVVLLGPFNPIRILILPSHIAVKDGTSPKG